MSKKRAAPEKQPEPEVESSWERFKSNVRTIGGAILLAVFIRIVLFEAFEIDGPSMEPTLQHGDRVVVAKMLYGLFLPNMHEAVETWGAPQVGDVVIVNSPADGVDIVKRVLAVGGDTIEIRDGQTIRNGEPIPRRLIGDCERDQQKEPNDICRVYEEVAEGVTYRISQGEGWAELDRGEIRIPEGHIYVRGDHRDHSNDSTNPLIGAIPVRRVKGKALFIYLSCDERDDGWFFCGAPRWDRFFHGVE